MDAEGAAGKVDVVSLKLIDDKETDKIRDEAKNNSGFGKKVVNWLGKDMVYPTNVLHLATECSNKNHSAAFPEGLPKWFIKLFTQEGDTVLDPYVGSGTTAVVAKKMSRNYIGIDRVKEYCDLAEYQLDFPKHVKTEEIEDEYEQLELIYQ